jgi:sensor histidine kinase regulating citrate/malate metabolism
MEHLLHLQKEQLEFSKQNIDIINIKCHDMKYQISRLGEKISEEEKKELEKAITIYDSSLKTGNETLDVILAEKSLICEKNNIKFDCMADGQKLSFMSASDIYSLFGNAIDNAIEGVSTITDLEKRIITLTVKESFGMVYVRIENFFSGTLVFENELPVSTKSNKEYHGFGLKSIKMLIDKYNGTFTINTSNEIFKLNMLFPLKEST